MQLLLTSIVLLPDEVEHFYYARVIKAASYFEFIIHVIKYFLAELFIFIYLLHLVNTCEGLLIHSCLTEVDITLCSTAKLLNPVYP